LNVTSPAKVYVKADRLHSSYARLAWSFSYLARVRALTRWMLGGYYRYAQEIYADRYIILLVRYLGGCESEATAALYLVLRMFHGHQLVLRYSSTCSFAHKACVEAAICPGNPKASLIPCPELLLSQVWYRGMCSLLSGDYFTYTRDRSAKAVAEVPIYYGVARRPVYRLVLKIWLASFSYFDFVNLAPSTVSYKHVGEGEIHTDDQCARDF
jgi:hypothetical protein